MDLKFHGVQVIKEGNDIQFVVKFADGTTDTIPVAEFFEEYLDTHKPFDLEITDPLKLSQKPPGFYEHLSEENREQIKRDLDLHENINQPDPQLNSYTYLRTIHQQQPPQLAWNGKNLDQFTQWQNDGLAKLRELVNYSNPKTPFNPIITHETVFDDIILQKVRFQSAPHLSVVGVLAYPKEIPKPLPAIITLHGHNHGKINTLGLSPSKSNSYYGMDLAKLGFVTFSLDQWGWGERTGRHKKLENKPEATFAQAALLMGKTALGIRAWDVTRAVDYLETLPFVNKRYGIIGHSGGGAATMYSSVLDDRFEVAVISGHASSMKHGLLSLYHCPCAYVPRLLQYFDIADIIALRAPKPTFIVNGEFDSIFPKAGTEEVYAKLVEIYKMHAKEDLIGIDIIPKMGHFFRGKYAYPFLQKHLLDHKKP